MMLSKDFLAGLLFAGLGLIAMVVSSGYGMGTANRMGPGYFPFAVGTLVLVLGVGLAVRGVLQGTRSPAGEREPLRLRPIVFVLASVIVFAFLVDVAGLVAAITALVVGSRLADTGLKAAETALIVVVLSAIASATFVFGLGMPLPLLPR